MIVKSESSSLFFILLAKCRDVYRQIVSCKTIKNNANLMNPKFLNEDITEVFPLITAKLRKYTS